MTFIAVVFGFMAVSILFIHWLTAHFGYKLDYRSLALCAVMAIIVTFGAIFTSKTLTWHYYLKLGLLTLVASGIVTAYDERLSRRRPSFAVAGADDRFSEEAEPSVLEKASSKAESAVDVPVVKAGHEAEQESSVTGSASTAEVRLPGPEANVSMLKPVEEVAQEANASLSGGLSVESVKPAMSVFEMHSQEKPVEASEPEIVPESVAGDSTEPNGILEQLDSLDDILDYAYEQRSKGNIEEAILANQMALERYAEDDYAPYIAIELGNIYKERAEYDSAIKVYEKSLNIPSVTGNDSTYQEFAKNLSYLRTILQVLSKHGAQDTPFGKIPQEYMEEIETDFQLRHN